MLLRIYTNTQPKKIAGKKAAIFTPSEPDFDIIIIWKLTYSYTHSLLFDTMLISSYYYNV